jgi:hypothetical protein
MQTGSYYSAMQKPLFVGNIELLIFWATRESIEYGTQFCAFNSCLKNEQRRITSES